MKCVCLWYVVCVFRVVESFKEAISFLADLESRLGENTGSSPSSAWHT